MKVTFLILSILFIGSLLPSKTVSEDDGTGGEISDSDIHKNEMPVNESNEDKTLNDNTKLIVDDETTELPIVVTQVKDTTINPQTSETKETSKETGSTTKATEKTEGTPKPTTEKVVTSTEVQSSPSTTKPTITPTSEGTTKPETSTSETTITPSTTTTSEKPISTTTPVKETTIPTEVTAKVTEASSTPGTIEPPDSASVPGWAIAIIAILISFAVFFTFMYFLRKYFLRKRRADRQRLLGRSQEGFFMGSGFAQDNANL